MLSNRNNVLYINDRPVTALLEGINTRFLVRYVNINGGSFVLQPDYVQGRSQHDTTLATIQAYNAITAAGCPVSGEPGKPGVSLACAEKVGTQDKPGTWRGGLKLWFNVNSASAATTPRTFEDQYQAVLEDYMDKFGADATREVVASNPTQQLQLAVMRAALRVSAPAESTSTGSADTAEEEAPF